jgi:hypothetical protein
MPDNAENVLDADGFSEDESGGGHGSAGRDAWREYQNELGPWPITHVHTWSPVYVINDHRVQFCVNNCSERAVRLIDGYPIESRNEEV